MVRAPIFKLVGLSFLCITSTTQSFLAFWTNSKLTSAFGTGNKLPVFMETLERFFVFFVSNFCAFVAIGLVITPVFLLLFLWQNPTTSLTEQILFRIMVVIIIVEDAVKVANCQANIIRIEQSLNIRGGIIEEPLIPHGSTTKEIFFGGSLDVLTNVDSTLFKVTLHHPVTASHTFYNPSTSLTKPCYNQDREISFLDF